MSWTFFLMRWIRVVDELPLYRNILICDIFPFNWHIINIFFWNYLWHVASDMLYSIIISCYNFSRYCFHSDNISIVSNNFLFWDHTKNLLVNVINYFLLYWDILNSAISFYNLIFHSLLNSRKCFRFCGINYWRSL